MNICRVCLSTDVSLQELCGTLLHYYEEICDFNTGFKQHYCCSSCKKSLQNNYDYKNLCVAANKLYHDWQKGKMKTHVPLSTLQDLLKNTLTETIEESENSEDDENDDTETIEESKNSEDDENDDIIINNTPINDTDITEDETENDIIKHEPRNFETIDCGNSGNDYKEENDENEIQNDLDVNNDSNSDDDRILAERKKKKNIRVKKTKEKCGQDKSNKAGQKNYHLRKSQSEYSEYEKVFDIQIFATDEEARKELLERRLSEPYISALHRCEVCYTVYKCDKLLQFHMKWHDPSSPHACDICSMRFSRQKSLQCHKARCHRGRFNCKLCPLITYYGSSMSAHFQQHQGKVFKCHCNRTFTHKSTFLTHKRVAHASEHVCVSCARQFVSERGLAKHRVRAHQNDGKEEMGKGVHCEPCDLTFKNQQIYTVHILNTEAHKEQAQNLMGCPDCGLQFSDALQVQEHRREAHPKFNYGALRRAQKGYFFSNICPLCGDKGGPNNTWLYQHFQSVHPTESYELRVRNDRRKHLCDQCGKGFYNITQLREHSYKHAGLKPFRCEKCPAAFSAKTNLRFHLERHGPPSKECNECGKKFVSSVNLSKHMRMHTGEIKS